MYPQFHQNLYHTEEKPLLKNMTDDEKAKLKEAGAKLDGEKEKIRLDETVSQQINHVALPAS